MEWAFRVITQNIPSLTHLLVLPLAGLPDRLRKICHDLLSSRHIITANNIERLKPMAKVVPKE
jgi:hypothetical protein